MINYHANWVKARINYIIEHYGKDWFENKSILELGSFESDIGGSLAALGAKVVCMEGRPDNIIRAKQKYPDLEYIEVDLENFKSDKKYDLVLNMGIIYHLKNFEVFIQECCKSADNMVLETEVIDSTKNIFNNNDEHGIDQSLHDMGTQISQTLIETILKASNFDFKRQDSPRLNGSNHYYDWESKDDNSYKMFRRRFWICSRSTHRDGRE